ncbi:MAG: ketopantoate reductase family protein [Bacteroidales bacterium]|nr:ketopantoate reductase family protein [Bacteroidales bacterium]
MKKGELSFLVIVAGAVGGITAALLKKSGYDVEIVARHEDYASLIMNTGIEISGVCGNFKAKIPAYASVSQVKDKKNFILHATKATDMLVPAIEAKELLAEDGYMVSMQNGICEDALGEIIGRDRIIGCVTGWGATMEKPGKLIMTSTGDFILGYPGKDPDKKLQILADALSSVVPVKTTGNIMGHLYSKLIINSCITSLGAICGLYLGDMLSRRKIRRIFIEIIREAVAVADGMNLKLEVFGGRLDFRRFLKGNSIFDHLRRHLLILIIGFKYRRLKSSSLQSLERGRPTEIDYLNGYIVSNGEKTGVPTPINRMIVSMIHEIESKKRTITLKNFDDPVFDRFN